MNSQPLFSRRQLLQLGSPLLISPACLVAAPVRSRVRFIVVSDTHLGYKGQEAAEARWLQAARSIDRSPGEFVLHLGDIVDGGQEAQYPKYLAGRELIHKPVHEIPGNHDPQELFRKHIRAEVDTAIEHDWLRVLLVNNAHTDSHDGFITAEQLAWLARQCEEAKHKQQYVIIAMHVPAHANRHPDRGWYVKPVNGQAKLYKLVEQHAARIIALFHGHFHNGIRGWDTHAPVHEICFPSALYNQDRKLMAGKAPGFNVPEFRAGFTIVTLQDSSMTLDLMPLEGSETVKKELRLQSD